MCPFSHGMLLVFLICFPYLHADGSSSSTVHASGHKETGLFLSTQSLSPPHTQAVEDRKRIDQMVTSDKEQIEKMTQTQNLRQDNRHVFLYEKQRVFDDYKRSLSYSVSLDHHDSLPNSKHKQNKLDNADEDNFQNVPLHRQRPNILQFVQKKHFRKLKAVHLKSCKVCSLKFDHKSSRLSGQYQTHRGLQPGNSRKRHLQNHKKRSHRTPNFTQTHRIKSIYSRRKRSPKKNKLLKKNKSHKKVDSLKESVEKNRSLTLNEESRFTTNAGLSSKQTSESATTRQTAYILRQAAERSDSSAMPQTPSVSQEMVQVDTTLTGGHELSDGNYSVLGVGLPEEQETSLKSSQSDHMITTSELGPEFAVENGTYLGLDGRPVNITEIVAALRRKEFYRQLNVEAQWAYLCVVLLMCLMMWTIWCLGGLERCRYRPDDTLHFTDLQPLVTVKDALLKRRQYLPMFNEPEWEEVLMCNRGSNP